VSNLDSKISAKHETLVNSQRQLQRYHELLNAKYTPVFGRMQEWVFHKKFEYLDYLTERLEENYNKIVLEKETL